MANYRNIAFIFPGQGAQYPGMGKDFFTQYSICKNTFEEAEDILKRNLSDIIFNGPEDVLKETKNSQVAIYVFSIALVRLLEQLFPALVPQVCAGLSLGEYSALTVAKKISFSDCLPIVQFRAQEMNNACQTTQGTMAVIIGLEGEEVEKIVKEVNLPQDLWAANFNCPGQVVISGTIRGIAAGTEAAKQKGAKRVLPLQVSGAFHSGLMRSAEEKLATKLYRTQLIQSPISLVMNVPGDYVKESDQIIQNLIKQVTSPVRWEQGIRAMDKNEVELYLELGPGKTLSGLNERIKVKGKTLNIGKIEDLSLLEQVL